MDFKLKFKNQFAKKTDENHMYDLCWIRLVLCIQNKRKNLNNLSVLSSHSLELCCKCSTCYWYTITCILVNKTEFKFLCFCFYFHRRIEYLHFCNQIKTFIEYFWKGSESSFEFDPVNFILIHYRDSSNQSTRTRKDKKIKEIFYR